MSDSSTVPAGDPRERAVARLNALSLENYRRTRWAAIDAARDVGMTWGEIGDAVGAEQSAARRMWLKKPEDD